MLQADKQDMWASESPKIGKPRAETKPCLSYWIVHKHPVELSLSFDFAAAAMTAAQPLHLLCACKGLRIAVQSRSLKAGSIQVTVPAGLPVPAGLTTQCIVTMKSLFGSPMLGLRSAHNSCKFDFG